MNEYPTPELIANRDLLIKLTDELFKKCSETFGIYINVGCGAAAKPNWINVDKFVEGKDIVNVDMWNLKYPDNYADVIFSSHSLEHLPIRHSHLALKNWYRILKPEGILFLSMPDISYIMRGLLSPNSKENKEWLMHTLFGWQADMNCDKTEENPLLDFGQFHQSGHSLESITAELIGDGYQIIKSFNYDGYQTPGLFVEARK
jgi:predicted SAM-dependent methyltransferase